MHKIVVARLHEFFSDAITEARAVLIVRLMTSDLPVSNVSNVLNAAVGNAGRQTQ